MDNNTVKQENGSNVNEANLNKLKSDGLKAINLNAAGIDVGGGVHFVAVPEGRDMESVKEFGCFTEDLYSLLGWLKKCGIDTVAMESTGVYWIPLYEILEAGGIQVLLVNARQIKNVSGRKTDVMDCQWIQRLHTYGLLQGAFRPEAKVCELRAYLRQRGMLIKSAGTHIQHMQKALTLMNLQLANVLSDVTGETGMRIIRAIVGGERDAAVLASHRDSRCKNSVATLQKSLMGHYKDEQVFALKQALELYDFYQAKIAECDRAIEAHLLSFEPKIEITEEKENEGGKPKSSKKKQKNGANINVRASLIRMSGVDLTKIPGIDQTTALTLLSEIGLDLSNFRSAKAFASWLGLSPENKISGGKLLSSKTKRTGSNAARCLRIAAFTLHKSKSSLGAFLRRLKARIGAPKAITALAHKLALIVYSMLKNGQEYVEQGQEYYENLYQDRVIKNLKKRAESLGFTILKNQGLSSVAG